MRSSGPNGSGKTTLFNSSAASSSDRGHNQAVRDRRDPPRSVSAGGARYRQNISDHEAVSEPHRPRDMLVACEALDPRKFTMHRPLSSCTDLAERASTLLAEFRLSAFERCARA